MTQTLLTPVLAAGTDGLDRLAQALMPDGNDGPDGVPLTVPLALLPGPQAPDGADGITCTGARRSMTGKARRAIRRDDRSWVRQALARGVVHHALEGDGGDLVNLGAAPLDTLPPEGWDPMMWTMVRLANARFREPSLLASAVLYGSPAMVELLLDAGAVVMRDGLPAEDFPSIGSVAVLDLLEQRGWFPANVSTQNRLWRACAHHRLDLVEAWCARGADLRGVDHQGRNALHHAVLPWGGALDDQGENQRQKHVHGWAVTERQHLDPERGRAMVDHLLEQGVAMEHRDAQGFTVLHTALALNPSQVLGRHDLAGMHLRTQACLVRHLIARGADVNADGPKGPPLLLAMQRHGWDQGMVHALWNAGARLRPPAATAYPGPPTVWPMSTLTRAAMAGSLPMLQFALALEALAGANGPGIDDQDWAPGMPCPPLVTAVEQGFEGGMAVLIEAGADPIRALEHPFWALAQEDLRWRPEERAVLVQRWAVLEQWVLRQALPGAGSGRGIGPGGPRARSRRL